MEKFTRVQLKLLDASIQAYRAVQREGRTLLGLQDRYRDYGSRGHLDSYKPNTEVKEGAEHLKEALDVYKKITPRPIQKILTWGSKIEKLEELVRYHIPRKG